MLEHASREAQKKSKLELHKELLDRHVSILIDEIVAKDKEIAELKRLLGPRRALPQVGASSLRPKLGKIKSSADLLLPWRSQSTPINFRQIFAPA